jgi:hypothetical protein
MRTAALALVVLAVACKPVVDAEEGEKAIKSWLSEQLGIEADEVTCPKDVERKNGKWFKCTAKAEGGELTIRVTQTNDDGNTRFGTSDIEGVIVSARLEDQIEQAFRERANMEVTVDCGRRHRVAVPGSTFNCEVENRKGEDAPIAVRIEDTAGNVFWKLDR